MNISKKRLAEIEKELNCLTVKKLNAIGNLSQYGKSNFGKGALIAGKTQFTCPHCNSSGKSYFFLLIHFDNCGFKGINFNQLSADIPIMYVNDLVKKYNISRHLIRKYAKLHNIPRKLERNKK